jgi:hypothetical protein
MSDPRRAREDQLVVEVMRVYELLRDHMNMKMGYAASHDPSRLLQVAGQIVAIAAFEAIPYPVQGSPERGTGDRPQ